MQVAPVPRCDKLHSALSDDNIVKTGTSDSFQLPHQNAQLEVRLQQGGLEVLTSLLDRWRELHEKTSGDDPYSRPEWILAFLRATLTADSKLVVLACWHDGALCALLPLTLERGTLSGVPLRKLCAVLPVAGAGAHLELAPGVDTDGVVRSLWGALKGFAGWDALELASVYENAGIARLSQLALADGYQSNNVAIPVMPYITLADPSGKRDVEKLPASGGFRKHLRQAERKLSALGSLNLQRFEKADAAVLQRFYELEASGWKGKEKSAILHNPARRQFFTAVAQEAEKSNSLSIYFLVLNDRLIAAHFGFVYDRRYFAPKIAYDEAYSECSPGHLIIREILRECAQRGISEYSMGVAEEWKLRWTKDVRKRSFIRIFNKGLRARVPFTVSTQIKPFLKKLARKISLAHRETVIDTATSRL